VLPPGSELPPLAELPPVDASGLPPEPGEVAGAFEPPEAPLGAAPPLPPPEGVTTPLLELSGTHAEPPRSIEEYESTRSSVRERADPRLETELATREQRVCMLEPSTFGRDAMPSPTGSPVGHARARSFAPRRSGFDRNSSLLFQKYAIHLEGTTPGEG
jgi:hypothetical protein